MSSLDGIPLSAAWPDTQTHRHSSIHDYLQYIMALSIFFFLCTELWGWQPDKTDIICTILKTGEEDLNLNVSTFFKCFPSNLFHKLYHSGGRENTEEIPIIGKGLFWGKWNWTSCLVAHPSIDSMPRALGLSRRWKPAKWTSHPSGCSVCS